MRNKIEKKFFYIVDRFPTSIKITWLENRCKRDKTAGCRTADYISIESNWFECKMVRNSGSWKVAPYEALSRIAINRVTGNVSLLVSIKQGGKTNEEILESGSFGEKNVDFEQD